MPARRAKKPPAKRAKRALPARGSFKLRAPALQPHQIDIVALALIAIGIFLGGVAYAHWAGGKLGDGAVQGARFALGALGYAIPAVLVATGVLVLMRELRPPARPLRTGGLCLAAALTLALAAGTLGLGPGAAPAAAFWHAPAFKARGGILGEGELWIAAHLLSTLGAQILSVFLALAGLILVTGATVAGVIRATGTRVAGTGRALKRSGGDLRRASAARQPTTAPAKRRQASVAVPEPLVPPEPETSELVVRATHVEAPLIEDGELELPGDDGESDAIGVRAAGERGSGGEGDAFELDGPSGAAGGDDRYEAGGGGAESDADGDGRARVGPRGEVTPGDLTPQGATGPPSPTIPASSGMSPDRAS